MSIVQCEEPQRAAWNESLSRIPGGTLYHRYEWREVNRACFGHRSAYLAAMDGARVAGIFPIVQVKSRLFGNIACSLPFVNYGGPCAENAELEGELLTAAAALADDWGVEYLEIRSRKPVVGALPTSAHKVSMTLDLDADPDVLWKAFSSAHRQDIRGGYKKGLSAKTGGVELMDDFYMVLSESWRDLGTPIYSKKYLARVAEAFPRESRITVVYSASGEPAAAAFDMLDGDTAEGLWLGSRGKFRRLYAGYVLYWELIKNACERGLTRFHLGRSTVQSGGEVFKKKWNAYPTQLYWTYVLRTRRDIPQLNVANPKYRLAIRAWQNLPVPVTQFVGPLIARSIP